jgi:hypothetical protein
MAAPAAGTSQQALLGDEVMESSALEHLERVVNELARTITELKARERRERADGEGSSREYLSVRQLAQLIPFREQTIRNLISTGEFKEGVHYHKRRRRVIFRWSAIQSWLGEQRTANDADAPFYPVHHARTRKRREAVL